MAEYIELETLYEKFNDLSKQSNYELYNGAINDCMNILDDMPIADVEPVVRCKDCRFCREAHYEDEGEPPYIKLCCKFSNYSKQSDDFCSLGKRKENNNDK